MSLPYEDTGGNVTGKMRWVAVIGICAGMAGDALGWGSTGHKFVNFNAVVHLPPSMTQITAQQAFFRDHASDADNRKSADTAEAPKHFIDLESYPDFSHLTPDLGSLIATYGWVTVKEIGILPWATVWAMDSLTVQLRRRDWTKSYQTAADLGHYVADGHQPLHCTVNYDGASTGNGGIHSRYETGMINQAQLVAVRDSARYVADRYAFILAYLLRANLLVDSIMQGDNSAKAASGWNGSGQAPALYYSALWQYCQGFTQRLLQEATVALASLWYTAWVDAALGVASVAEAPVPAGMELMQNYPNPFNGRSEIGFEIARILEVGPRGSGPLHVRLRVFDLLGREVSVLVDEPKAPGSYRVSWDAGGLPSGVYFSSLEAGGQRLIRRMVLVR
jgi:hypothetical protein